MAANNSPITNATVYSWYVRPDINGLTAKELYGKFKIYFDIPSYQQLQSETRLYTKLKELEKKTKSHAKKAKQSEKAAAVFEKFQASVFKTVSETNVERSLKAAVSDREVRLSEKIMVSNQEKKSLKRKVGELEIQVAEKNTISAKYEMEVEETLTANEKIAEMNKTINDLGVENGRLATLNESLQTTLENIENEHFINLDDMRSEKHRLQKKITYTKMKLKQFTSLGESREKLEKEVELASDVKQLKKENCDLQDLVALLQRDEIVTFENGRYTNDVREVIMELLNMNVSMGRINDVITTVLGKLGSQTVGRLPSAGAKCRILQESLILAQKQVADAMLEGGIEENVGNTLHGDGTSKFHRHFQNFQITTKAGRSYSFGLAEVASGDVAATMCALEEAMEGLAAAIGTETDDNFAHLVSSIKTTMSDLGPVNPGFNAQLKTLRETLLPKAVKNWSILTDEQKAQIKEMANFFCKVHVLANFATECDSVLKLFEKMMLDESYSPVFAFNSKESCGVRLVRTACKAFHERGCDKSGVGGHFNSFLAGKDDKSYLANFIGNRFNILFYNAAAVYYHRGSITDFVKSWPEPNNLLKAVLEDISHELFQAEIRALGIVDKLVTGPLWRLIESADSILSLNPHLFHLKMQLSKYCNDASPIFLHGKTVFDEDTVGVEHHRDKLFERLFETTSESFDILTQQCLEVLFHGLLIILERQCVDQLPGGKYWNPSDNLKSTSQNVPTTNKISEGDFGIIDLLVRTKPNASCEAMLALIMWSRNGTIEWLNNLPESTKEVYFDDARKKFPQMKKKYEERKTALKKQKLEMLVKKQNEKKEKEVRAAAKKINAVNNLVSQGLQAWISCEQVDEQLATLQDIEKSNVLLTQLEFYKHVIDVKCPPNLFHKTKVVESNKRVNRSWEELRESFLEVLKFNMIVPEDQGRQNSSLKAREQRDESFEAGKGELTRKMKDARMKRFTANQTKTHMSKFMEEPELLVGKIIQQQFSDDGEKWWEKATVTGVGKTNKNVKRTQYSVVYESTPDDTYHVSLLVELGKGSLIIL